VAEKGVPTEGPWIELIGQIGSAPEVARVAESLASEKFADPAAITRAARSLIAAVARNIPISGDTKRVIARVRDVAPQEAVRLAGALRFPVLDFYAEQVQANPADAEAVFESMALARSPEIRAFLESILNVGTPKQPTGAAALALLKNPSASLRQRALVALATVDPDAALAALPGQLAVVPETELPALWRQLLKSTAFIKKLSTAIPAEMPKPAARAALRAAREIGKRGQPLITPFAALAGENPADAPADYTGLADYVRKNGNPAEGEIIYRRAALACTVCHAIGGAGGKVGPDMTTIGLSAPLDYLIESVLAPGAKVKEGYHAVVLNLAGGRTQSGVIVREDDKECLVRDAAGSEIAVPKASITSRENIGSIMPAGLTAGLNPREQAALFAFLSQLGKPGPFDASRANVARTWNLYPESALDELLASGTVTKPGQRALPLVSGNFPREQLSELLPFIPGQHKTVLATARFAVAQAGSIRFTLTGVTHAWLNGKALAIASDPRPVIELTPGTHTLAVQLPVDQLPDTLRAEAEGVRFLNE
jgi:putative heme-binding domain-containing protein